MKKFVVIGILAGTAISLAIALWKKRKFEGSEFEDFLDSSSLADDLFGEAFKELPDKP